MFKINFKIKKGRHRSWNIPKLAFNQNIGYTVRLSVNAWYRRDQVSSTGVNKIRGRTYGILPRIKKYNPLYTSAVKLPFKLCLIKPAHWDSDRFGWQPNFSKKNVLDIYVYLYRKGVRFYEKIGQTEVNQTFTIKFETEDDLLIRFSGRNISAPACKGMGLQLYPYFGGKSKAPATMKIYAKKW